MLGTNPLDVWCRTLSHRWSLLELPPGCLWKGVPEGFCRVLVLLSGQCGHPMCHPWGRQDNSQGAELGQVLSCNNYSKLVVVVVVVVVELKFLYSYSSKIPEVIWKADCRYIKLLFKSFFHPWLLTMLSLFHATPYCKCQPEGYLLRGGRHLENCLPVHYASSTYCITSFMPLIWANDFRTILTTFNLYPGLVS